MFLVTRSVPSVISQLQFVIMWLLFMWKNEKKRRRRRAEFFEKVEKSRELRIQSKICGYQVNHRIEGAKSAKERLNRHFDGGLRKIVI